MWSVVSGVFFLVMGGAAWGQVLDAMVARVDREVITWSRVLQERQLQRFLGAPETDLTPEAVRDALVERRLLIAEADKLRLKADVQQARQTVRELAEEVGAERFWGAMAHLGMDRDDLEEWSARRQLVEQYLDLRRELTFVRESEVRAFYQESVQMFEGRSLAEVRDEIRARLSRKRYREELDQWVSRQVTESRVELLPLPETP